MTNTTTLYSNNTLNTEFMKELNVNLNIRKNVYDLPLGSLFNMAARKNPKRNFLFVSNLLGKHIPVPPQIPILNGLILADLFLKQFEGSSPYNADLIKEALVNYRNMDLAMKELDKPSPKLSKATLFLGFAETATGLGHAMFHPFRDNEKFIHTTREIIMDLESSFNFEEEHSHATSHLCFSLEDNYFEQFERIVLVDDEVTTGNTALNLIEALNSKFPNKEYVVASILDWRNNNEIEKFKEAERKLGVKIDTLTLVEGDIEYITTPLFFEETFVKKVQDNEISVKTIPLVVENNLKSNFTTKKETNNEKIEKLYYHLTGRFGLTGKDTALLEHDAEKFANILKAERTFDNTLCIGFGEFIFVPALIASKLGDNVKYHSLTRSPIYAIDKEGYPIKNAIAFDNPEDKSIKNFIYNILPNQYEQVIMFLERNIDIETKDFLSNEMSKLGVKSLIFAHLE